MRLRHRKLFGIHIWKDGPRIIHTWKPVCKGARVLVARYETPDEYHSRPANMLTIFILGKCITFRFRK